MPEKMSVSSHAAGSPILDVLVPHYNDVAGLQASLASIVQQTWTGALRVVIVDDGSSPANFEELERVVAVQPFPVKVHRLEQNAGRPHARNILLSEVDAPYMAWLDAGEVWYREKLRLQFEHLRELELEGVDLDRVWVTCHYHWLQNGRQRRMLQRTNADQLSDLLIGDMLRAYLWTLVGRTTAFRGAGMFDEKLLRLQDLDYFIRFLEAGGTLSAPRTRAPLCRYDKSDAGRRHEDVKACADLIVRKHRPAYVRYGTGFVARARWKHAKLAARFAKNNGSYVAMLKYLAVAVLSNPRYALFKLRTKVIGA